MRATTLFKTEKLNRGRLVVHTRISQVVVGCQLHFNLPRATAADSHKCRCCCCCSRRNERPENIDSRPLSTFSAPRLVILLLLVLRDVVLLLLLLLLVVVVTAATPPSSPACPFCPPPRHPPIDLSDHLFSTSSCCSAAAEFSQH